MLLSYNDGETIESDNIPSMKAKFMKNLQNIKKDHNQFLIESIDRYQGIIKKVAKKS